MTWPPRSNSRVRSRPMGRRYSSRQHSSRRPISAWRSERGNASVEFVGWSMALLIPLTYLVVALAQIQAASFGVHQGVDAASRILAVDASPQASTRAQWAASLALSDQHVAHDDAPVRMACMDTSCSVASLHVEVSVPLPLLGGMGATIAHVHADRIVHTAWGRKSHE